MKTYIITILSLSVLYNLSAQNPIVPAGLFIADPTARVMPNGKLYIYGSADESTDYYCSHTYHVLSTSDLKNWEIHYNTFSSKGENDQVPYNDKLLFAPDCIYKNGKYYLYYCQPDPDSAEGVAVSDSPKGPFTSASFINTGGFSEIDPAVFIDDDGTAWYTWGQFSAKLTKLNSDMRSIDTTTIIDGILTEEEHHFHEGGFLTKRNEIYYYVYAHMGRANTPSAIGYATANRPEGPYAYRGVIIDNDNCDPSNWNNHGSIAEYKGQWYVFYHRATHNSRKMRKACMEPIIFREDGTIPEVEMTTQGAGPPLNPFEKLEAERACLLFGNVRIELDSTGIEKLSGIRDKDRVAYKYLDFSAGIDSVIVSVKQSSVAGKIIIRTGQPWRNVLATIDIPASQKKRDSWLTLSKSLNIPGGIEALWLEFRGSESEDNFELDWIQFEKKADPKSNNYKTSTE